VTNTSRSPNNISARHRNSKRTVGDALFSRVLPTRGADDDWRQCRQGTIRRPAQLADDLYAMVFRYNLRHQQRGPAPLA
jgi:hypothetical protein